ncbi:MAG: hypothetical protein ACKOXQ_04645 [Hydrogenophaga sp.]
MRSAPSVIYPVGRCAFHLRVVCLLGLLGLLGMVLLWWWRSPSMSPALWALAAACWLWWCGLALGSWAHAPSGQLQWDAMGLALADDARSGRWSWQAQAGASIELQRFAQVWDMQSVILLQPVAAGQRLPWLWLEARQAPHRWDDLRRALTAHAGG